LKAKRRFEINAGSAEDYRKMGLPLPPFSWENIHPILVNFTAALIPVSVFSDVVGKLLRRESLHHTAWWTLLFAAAITPATALAGWFWKKSIEAALPPDIIAIHQWLGISLAVAFIILALWRGLLHRRDESPSPVYLLLAILVSTALLYQGHLGGSMTFG
jgi:uncharacterized membrane protein